MRRRFGHGFTLVELLVTIAIIAVLAIVVLLAVNPSLVLRNARDAKRSSQAGALQKAIEQYLTDNTSLPGSGAVPRVPAQPLPICKQGVTLAAGKSVQLNAADNQYFITPDNASLSLGSDTDFWISAWVYPEATPSYQLIFDKTVVANGTGEEYRLGSANSTDYVFTFGNGSYYAIALAADALTTGRWQYLLAWHDAVHNTINLRVDSGAVITSSWTGGTQDTPSAVTVGSWSHSLGSGLFTGRIDSLAFGKSPSGGIAGIIDEIADTLYRDGVGASFGDVANGQKAAWGLVSFWDLDETGGDRADSYGGNTLTQIGAPTYGDGVSVGRCFSLDFLAPQYLSDIPRDSREPVRVFSGFGIQMNDAHPVVTALRMGW